MLSLCRDAARMERQAPDLVRTGRGHEQHFSVFAERDAVGARDSIDQAREDSGGGVTVDAAARVLQASLPLVGEVDIAPHWRKRGRSRP